MRILVTGAGGFVGQHLCRHLAAHGDEVLALSGPADPEWHGFRAEITDAAAVRKAVEGARPDAIVHLAGFASVASSQQDPSGTFAVNVLGTVNLLTAVRDTAPKARVLVIGSAEMYGAVAPGLRISEDAPFLPLSPYASSKVASEVAAFQFHRGSGVAAIGARPFNHLGAGQRLNFVVPSFAAQLVAVRRRRAEPVLRVGNLDAVRDFAHVDDVVEAYRLLVHQGQPGQAYNVCSGQGRTIRSLLDRMIALAEVEVRIDLDPARLRPSDIPSQVGDPGKLERLGWRPSRTIDDALRAALAHAEAEAERS